MEMQRFLPVAHASLPRARCAVFLQPCKRELLRLCAPHAQLAVRCRRFSIAAKPERPKARTESEKDRNKRTFQQWGAVAVGIGALVGGLAWAAHATGRTVTEVIQDAIEGVRSLGQVDAEDLSAALPPFEVYSDPDTGAEGIPRGPVLLRAPTGTLVLGWEGTCVDVVYDPRAGYLPLPRPGLVELLLACADADIEVAIWSCSASAGTVEEQLKRLITGLIAQEDADRYADFRAFVLEGYERSRVEEAATAAKEGRAPRFVVPISDADVPDYYRQCVLRIAGVLGKELCHAAVDGQGKLMGGPNKGRDVEMLTSGRRAKDVLLVVREDEVPAATVPSGSIVLAVPPYPNLAQPGKGTGKGGREQDEDPTLMLMSAMIRRFGEEHRAAKASTNPHDGGLVRLGLQDFIHALDSRAREAKVKPNTGKAVDVTVGVLGLILKEEQQRLREKQAKGKSKGK